MSDTPPCPIEALLEDKWFQSEWYERSHTRDQFFSASQKDRTITQHLDRKANKPGNYNSAILDDIAKLATKQCCVYWHNAHERPDLEGILESDSDFYTAYTGLLLSGRGLSDRVPLVQHWIKKLVPNWCSNPVPGKDYDQARTLALYFDERYKPKPAPKKEECPPPPKPPNLDAAGLLLLSQVLLKNKAFMVSYKSKAAETTRAASRRHVIQGYLPREGPKTSPFDREMLRRYFDYILGSSSATHDKLHGAHNLEHLETVQFWLSNPCVEIEAIAAEFIGTPLDPDFQPPTPIENTMTKAITITTKTFANGNDVATMSDGEIYNLIAAQEAEIRELEKIHNKPKRLLKELESRQAGVKALVDYLDTKE